jgi:hypothetical protein
MGLLGNRAIAARCKKCGYQCRTTTQAARHCRGRVGVKPKPAVCVQCGIECSSTRAAYTHCQQAGTQRGRLEPYVWRNHETPERAYQRRVDEIRSDPVAMAEIHHVALELVKLLPP